MMKVNYCGRKQQEKMIKNGWHIKVAVSYTETPEQIYERLSTAGYTNVKVYYSCTMIKGLHSFFAMVK